MEKNCHKTNRTCGKQGKVFKIYGINMATGEMMRPKISQPWNQLLSGLAADFSKKVQHDCHCLQHSTEDDQRIQQSVSNEGVLTLTMRQSLKKCDPDAFNQVMKFAIANNLWIRTDSE